LYERPLPPPLAEPNDAAGSWPTADGVFELDFGQLDMEMVFPPPLTQGISLTHEMAQITQPNQRNMPADQEYEISAPQPSTRYCFFIIFSGRLTEHYSWPEFCKFDSFDCQVSKNIRRFACNQCKGAFRSRKDLNRHVSSIHEKTLQFFCEEAGCRRGHKGFARKDHLLAHHRRMHTYPLDHETSVRPAKSCVTGACTAGKDNAVFDLLRTHTQDALVKMVLLEQERRKEIEAELNQLKSILE
jgi:hypothetical protein